MGGLELIHHACMAKNGKFVNLNPIALGREGRVRKGCDEESRGGGSPSFMQFIHPCMICHLNTYSMIHTCILLRQQHLHPQNLMVDLRRQGVRSMTTAMCDIHVCKVKDEAEEQDTEEVLVVEAEALEELKEEVKEEEEAKI